MSNDLSVDRQQLNKGLAEAAKKFENARIAEAGKEKRKARDELRDSAGRGDILRVYGTGGVKAKCVGRDLTIELDPAAVQAAIVARGATLRASMVVEELNEFDEPFMVARTVQFTGIVITP